MNSSKAVKSKPAINSVTQACVSGLASPMLAMMAEVYRMEAFSGSRQVIAPSSSGTRHRFCSQDIQFQKGLQVIFVYCIVDTRLFGRR